MKFTTALLLVISYVAVVSAHVGMLYPTPRGGYGTKQFNGRFHVKPSLLLAKKMCIKAVSYLPQYCSATARL